MSWLSRLFGFRKSKKVGKMRITATHRGISTSTKVGPGLRLSSKRGLTFLGRKVGKRRR